MSTPAEYREALAKQAFLPLLAPLIPTLGELGTMALGGAALGGGIGGVKGAYRHYKDPKTKREGRTLLGDVAAGAAPEILPGAFGGAVGGVAGKALGTGVGALAGKVAPGAGRVATITRKVAPMAGKLTGEIAGAHLAGKAWNAATAAKPQTDVPEDDDQTDTKSATVRRLAVQSTHGIPAKQASLKDTKMSNLTPLVKLANAKQTKKANLGAAMLASGIGAKAPGLGAKALQAAAPVALSGLRGAALGGGIGAAGGLLAHPFRHDKERSLAGSVARGAGVGALTGAGALAGRAVGTRLGRLGAKGLTAKVPGLGGAILPTPGTATGLQRLGTAAIEKPLAMAGTLGGGALGTAAGLGVAKALRGGKKEQKSAAYLLGQRAALAR